MYLFPVHLVLPAADRNSEYYGATHLLRSARSVFSRRLNFDSRADVKEFDSANRRECAFTTRNESSA